MIDENISQSLLKKENNWYENYVIKLSNSKYHFTEIDEKNIDKIKYEDIAFFQIAERGAMGEHGGIELFTKNIKFYHTNIYKRYNIFDMLMTNNLKKFKGMRISCGSAKNVPNDFKYYYLGMGNYLFVKKEYSAIFEKMLKNLLNKYQIYGKWKDFAIQIFESDTKIK